MAHATHTVQIQSAAFGTPLEFILDADVPAVTSGVTAWEEVARPKRRSAIEWTGMALYRVALSGIFDGFREGRSVEPEIKKLEVMATARHGILEPPPPVKILSGPVPHQELEYVIESIEWTNAIWEDHFRVRQHFKLTLAQKVDLETTLREQTRSPRKAKTRYRTVTVQDGLNLREMAAIMLGNSARWREILSTKGKRFRDYKVAAGTKVKVPVQ